MTKPLSPISPEFADWKPLPWSHEIEPGSALDFSSMLEGPAGRHGRLIVQNDKFAFENAPERPVRFYGVNLCGAANFPDKDACHRLVARLAACGYNSVRFHHHDYQLTKNTGVRATELDPVEMDKLDYLFHCLKQRGFYLTTDLYVSRQTAEAFEELGRPTQNWEEFKFLIYLLEPARQNWEDFSRNFLLHVNPYTGIAWKDDPALVTLSCINEAAIFHCYQNATPDVRKVYDDHFEAWLLKRGTTDVIGDHRTALLNLFLVETRNAAFAKMRAFYDSLGCKPLLTDQNHWSIIPMALLRETCDYVDDHFYWDHPEHFHLPSKILNTSSLTDLFTIFSGIFPGRVFGKPYTISEFNWVCPNRFRAESGPITGAYAALQDWDALYRFDYASHPLESDATGGYFQIRADPINSLSDLISVILFQRGDVQSSPVQFPLAISSTHMEGENPVTKYPDQLWRLGFLGQIGSVVERAGKLDLPPKSKVCIAVSPGLESAAGKKVPCLRADGDASGLEHIQRECVSGGGAMEGGFTRSSTGEIELDENNLTFKVITPKSEVLVFCDKGGMEGAVLSARNSYDSAVLFASSLDGKPLRDSGRILMIHLTDAVHHDLEFTGNVIEKWGTLPHLVRRGEAEVELKLSGLIGVPKVWALDMTGCRTREVNATIASNGTLAFKADTLAAETACLLYEIIR